MESSLDRVVSFLRGIGLEVHIAPGARGFIDFVRIDKGALLVDPACPISGLLHESGHVATVPRRFRHLLNDDLEAGISTILETIQRDGVLPDSPLYRAVIQCSDPEATAWAFAAGSHLGFPASEIIKDDEYVGQGRSVRLGLSLSQYIGIHGLAHAGFCSVNRFGKLPQYPRLAFWTQEA